MPLNGAAVAYCVAGGLILYSGIKGATIADTVGAVLSGNLSVTDTETIAVTNDSTATAGSSSASDTGGVTVTAGASQTAWNKSLLQALGAPATAANLASLQNWEAHEEPPSDWNHGNNPMNTTQKEPGSIQNPAVTSASVQEYPSLQVGLNATVATLHNGLYGDIIMQLKSGNGLRSGAAHGLSTWSGGAYTSV